MTNKQIEWRPIPGFKGYLVSNEGKVQSRRNHKPIILKPYIDKYGYEVVGLIGDQGRKALKVHRAVALTFLEPIEGKTQVNHKDGVKTNNMLSNLEWVSNSENIIHALDTGLLKLYTKGIIVTDTIADNVVGYYHGYEKLVEMTGLSKLTLIDIAHDGSLLYGAYKIERHNSVDYSSENLFNNIFIKRNISQRKKPLCWGATLYESGREFQRATGVSSRRYPVLMKDGVYKDKPLYNLTQYEFVNF